MAQVEVINTYTTTPGNGYVAFPDADGTIGVESYQMDLTGFGSVAMDSVNLDTLRLILSLTSNDLGGAAVRVLIYDIDTLLTDDRTFVLPQDGASIWGLNYPDVPISTEGFVQVVIDPANATNAGRATQGTWFIPNVTPPLVGASPGNFDGIPNDANGVQRNYALQMVAVLRSLPVTYGALALNADKDRLRLDWTTTEEAGNEGFAIERSTDGTSFEEIGFTPGRGTTGRPNDYTFADATVLPNVPYFYRLKQMDYDGGFAYSEVLSGMLRGEGNITAGSFSPNPTADLAWLPISLAKDGAVTLELFTTEGRRVRNLQTQLGSGSQRLELNVADLPAGTYVAVLRNGEETVRRRLIIR